MMLEMLILAVFLDERYAFTAGADPNVSIFVLCNGANNVFDKRIDVVGLMIQIMEWAGIKVAAIDAVTISS